MHGLNQSSSTQIGAAQIPRPWANAALALVPAIFALLLYPRLGEMTRELAQPGIGAALANSDFVNYWMAGRLGLEGNIERLFDPNAYFEILKARFGPGYPPHVWSYPPHAVLLCLPLGQLGYKAAMLVFLGASLGLYVLAAARFFQRFGQLGNPAVFAAAQLGFVAMNLAAAQNGFLIGALLLVFLTEQDRRPLLAALCLALLTVKPQLGLLIPPMLVFSRSWRLIGFTVLLSGIFVSAAIWAFGTAPWIAYVEHVLPVQRSVLTEWQGTFLSLMPSLVATLRIIGAPGEPALQLQYVYSLVLLPIAIWALWRQREGDILRRGFVFLTATFALSPYIFAYDMGPLVAAAALVLANGTRDFSHYLICWLICLLPAALLALGSAAIPIGPLVLLAAFLIAAISPESERRPRS
jgi:Glycosyltransferase family 87